MHYIEAMQDSSNEITAIQPCYFAVKGFDMCGADFHLQTDFASEDEAIAAIKKRINFNENYCAALVRTEEGRYHFFIKNKVETNPSMNADSWHKCTNIFFGKRFIRDKGVTAKKQMPEEKLQYFATSGLDMFGGDMEIKSRASFEQALEEVERLIDHDPSRCGTIQDHFQSKQWQLFLKDPKKCNPSYISSNKNHWRSTSVFLGKEV